MFPDAAFSCSGNIGKKRESYGHEKTRLLVTQLILESIFKNLIVSANEQTFDRKKN